MAIGFLKEIMLNNINTASNFETLQYLGQNVYLLPLILIFFIPLVVTLITYLCSKKNFWLSMILGELIRFVLIGITILGILPLNLSIQ